MSSVKKSIRQEYVNWQKEHKEEKQEKDKPMQDISNHHTHYPPAVYEIFPSRSWRETVNPLKYRNDIIYIQINTSDYTVQVERSGVNAGKVQISGNTQDL